MSWHWCKLLLPYQDTLGMDTRAYTQHVDVRKVAEYFQSFWIQEQASQPL